MEFYLEHQQSIRGDVLSVTDGRNESPELHGGRGVNKVIYYCICLSFDEEDTLAIAVNLDPIVLISSQPPGHGVEGHQGPGQCGLQHLWVIEIGGSIGPVEVDAGGVHFGNHQVHIRVPQDAPWSIFSGPHHNRRLHIDDHRHDSCDQWI